MTDTLRRESPAPELIRSCRIDVTGMDVAPGDHVVIVGALPFRPGAHTNFVKLHSIGAARR